MSDTAAWNRLTDAINATLPEWARYSGYGTYALAGYCYTVFMAAVAVAFYSWGNTNLALVFGALSGLAWLLGSYYRGAAAIRVTCDHCGKAARGETVCPHCGEVTYNGDSE